jgi:hypothetical protein
MNQIGNSGVVGGYRIEVRISMSRRENGFEEALDFVVGEKLLILKHLEKRLYGVLGRNAHSSLQLWKKEISPSEYLKFANAMLHLSYHIPDELAGGGLICGRNSQKLSTLQKEMWIDLILSIGHIPTFCNAKKIMQRDDSLKNWIGNWENKEDIKYFEGGILQRNQKFAQFVSLQNGSQLILAASKRLEDHKILQETAPKPVLQNGGEMMMLKHLRVRHPPKSPSKYCAIRTSNGGCTKGFHTVEELIHYLVEDMKKNHPNKKWENLYQSIQK